MDGKIRILYCFETNDLLIYKQCVTSIHGHRNVIKINYMLEVL